MSLLDDALQAGREGDSETEKRLFAKAFERERDAALKLKDDETEPSRSVLFRSAAALANDAKLYRESERMIAYALAGNPPPSVAGELRDLWDRVKFNLNLEHDNFQPLSNQLSVSFYRGSRVGDGIVAKNDFSTRLNSIESLIQRTVSRKAGRSFSESRSVPSKYKKDLETFVSLFHSGSFGFKIQVGAAKQLRLDGVTGESIVEDVMNGFSLLNTGKHRELEDYIGDYTYYRNFIVLSRKIAPDGKRVKGINVTSKQFNFGSTIFFRNRDEMIKTPPKSSLHSEDEIGEIEEIEGFLKAASSLKGSFVKLKPTGAEKSKKIEVPAGMMQDVVNPFFGERVIIEARKEVDNLVLVDIYPSE